jgi:predicted nuclease of predicted toxin-antitoxin system
VRFFFDNNLPIRLARALQALAPEHEIIHLIDKFAANTPDADWMRGLAGELGWVIISGDIRIGKNLHEVQA